MTKFILTLALSLTALARPAAAVDLMGTSDPCELDRLSREPFLIAALRRPAVSRVLCWHQDAKLLAAASVLTQLIRTRTATFVEGVTPLDLSMAALAGYRLDSLVRYWEEDRVFLALVLSRRGPASPAPLAQTYEISPNHFFAR